MNQQQGNDPPQKIKECYGVEIDSAGEIEIKDLIMAILREKLNQIDW